MLAQVTYDRRTDTKDRENAKDGVIRASRLVANMNEAQIERRRVTERRGHITGQDVFNETQILLIAVSREVCVWTLWCVSAFNNCCSFP